MFSLPEDVAACVAHTSVRFETATPLQGFVAVGSAENTVVSLVSRFAEVKW
ncbi:hypothetical protein [Polymorphospora sp. NPDC050346]|uniref:hypothetical protein n=1 Tax=Polymorphospora sp. NPDC050346 TaxID=3155780 RepID=UPI0033FCF3BE